MTASPPPTDSEIIADAKSGELVVRLLGKQQYVAELETRIVDLHNGGQLDLFALLSTPPFLDLKGGHFYRAQTIICEILPRLDGSLPVVMDAVRILVERGGRDGVFPAEAFRQWLAGDKARAAALVSMAETDPDLNQQWVADGLTILADISRAETFLVHTDGRRRAAVSALGTMALPDQAAATHVLDVLLARVEKETDEGVRFTAIFSTLSILKSFTALAPSYTPRLVALVSANPSNDTRIALLQGLWRQSIVFAAPEAEATLEIAFAGDLGSGELANILRVTVGQLLGGPYHALAVSALTRMLSRDDDTFTLETMQSVSHELRSLPNDQVFAICAGWFGSSQHRLCEAAAALLRGPEAYPPFTQSLAGLGLTGVEMVILCHRAISYLLLTPIGAASFVLAALRAGDKTIEPELVQLLVHPLLLNYGGDLREYLTKIPKTDLAHKAVRKALKAHGLYVKGLQIDPPVKELWPSQTERTAVRQRQIALGREIQKSAERQSVFFGLMQRSTLLYGRRSLTYAGGANEPPREIDLKSISTGFEMPQLDTIDPVGLDNLLRIFRVSRPK